MANGTTRRRRAQARRQLRDPFTGQFTTQSKLIVKGIGIGLAVVATAIAIFSAVV